MPPAAWGLATAVLSAAGEGVASGSSPAVAIVLALIPAVAGIAAAWVATSRRNTRDFLDDDEVAVPRDEWERLTRLDRQRRRGR